MNYCIDPSTSTGDRSTGAGLKPGINENVLLTEVAYKASSPKEGAAKALVFTFNIENGTYPFEAMFFELDPAKIKENAKNFQKEHKVTNSKRGYIKGKEITPDQAVQLAFDEQAVKIKHIMTKFMSEDEILINAANFAQFASQVTNLLKGKTADKKVRLKITLSSKDYYQLPFVPFIESMDVEKSELKINPKDKVTKSTPSPEPDSKTTELDPALSGFSTLVATGMINEDFPEVEGREIDGLPF